MRPFQEYAAYCLHGTIKPEAINDNDNKTVLFENISYVLRKWRIDA